MKISQNIPDNRFILIQKYTKKPISLDWTNKPVSKEKAHTHLEQKGNIGFLLGSGYVCVDCDSPELQLAVEQLLPETYTQKSARKGLNHYFFKCDFQDNLTLEHSCKAVGEVLTTGKQVILAPSCIKISKKDIEKLPEYQFKLNEIRHYEVLKDIPITEITKEQLLKLVFQFDSNLLSKAESSLKGSYEPDTEIDSLRITDFVSTAGMEKDSRGQYVGSNPWHNSTTGSNFYVNPSKNLAYCFHTGCQCAINPIKAFALNEGIIKTCSDSLKGSDFLETKKRLKEKGIIKTPQHLEHKDTAESKPLNLWTIQDYESYKPDKEFIIENMLYPQESSMLYAPSGSFKSLFCLSQALSVASGKKFLGKFKVKRKAVLYVSAENSLQLDKDRIKKMLRGLRVRKKDIPFFVLPRNECEDIMTSSFQVKLVQKVKEKNIKVIFLDTINPLTPEVDDNKGKDVTAVFNNFIKPLIDKYGCSVIFLHHTTKTEASFLGSVKWKANADTIFRISRKDLSPVFKLYNEKNRTGETNTLELKIESDDKQITFKVLSESSPEIYSKQKKMTQAELFELKLNQFVKDKKTERKEIFEIFKQHKIRFSRASLDRAIQVWKAGGLKQ